jgi:hypothetical protein
MLFGDSQSPQQKDAICEKIPSLTALKCNLAKIEKMVEP